MGTLKTVLLGVAALVVAVAVVLGGWAAGWWFKTQNTNRESNLYQHQYGRQTALRDDISRKLGAVTDITVQLADPAVTSQQAAALSAQRLAVARQVCADAEQVNKVTDLPPDQQDFVTLNCSNGDVSATSTLRP